MTTKTLDLAPAAIYTRAADVVAYHGLAHGDFINDGGYCTAAAIGDACDLSPDDWFDDARFEPADLDENDGWVFDKARREWQTARAASLAALRAFAAHIYPDSKPEDLSRDALIGQIGSWNDARTQAQVIAALRDAAKAVTE